MLTSGHSALLSVLWSQTHCVREVSSVLYFVWGHFSCSNSENRTWAIESKTFLNPLHKSYHVWYLLYSTTAYVHPLYEYCNRNLEAVYQTQAVCHHVIPEMLNIGIASFSSISPFTILVRTQITDYSCTFNAYFKKKTKLVLTSFWRQHSTYNK